MSPKPSPPLALATSLLERRRIRTEQLDQVIEAHLKRACATRAPDIDSAFVVIKAIHEIAQINGLLQSPSQELKHSGEVGVKHSPVIFIPRERKE